MFGYFEDFLAVEISLDMRVVHVTFYMSLFIHYEFTHLIIMFIRLSFLLLLFCMNPICKWIQKSVSKPYFEDPTDYFKGIIWIGLLS